MCVCMCVRVRTLSCSVGSYSLWPHGLWDARLSVGFPRQEYWSGLPFPNPGDLPNPGTEPMSLASPAFVGRFFTIAPPGKPHMIWRTFTPLILSPVWKLLRGRDYSPFPSLPTPCTWHWNVLAETLVSVLERRVNHCMGGWPTVRKLHIKKKAYSSLWRWVHGGLVASKSLSVPVGCGRKDSLVACQHPGSRGNDVAAQRPSSGVSDGSEIRGKRPA